MIPAKNNGKGKSNVLQNQFTAYLQTALFRERCHYLKKKRETMQNEEPTDFSDQIDLPIHEDTEKLLAGFPVIERLENPKLLKALKQTKEQELKILIGRILDDQTFNEISQQLGIPYKTVTTIYYRLLARLRKELNDNEFR